MKNRLLLYLTAGLILLALAITVDRSYKDTNLLQDFAFEVSQYTNARNTEARAWVEGHKTVLQGIAAHPGSVAEITAAQQGLAEKPYTILLYRKDTLLFWSNDKTILTGGMLAGLDRVPADTVLLLPAGHYTLHRESLGFASVSVLMPIRNGAGAQGVFPANPAIPGMVNVSTSATHYALDLERCAPVWLSATDSLQPPWVQWLKLGAYALLLLLVLMGVNKGALWLAGRYHPLTGLALVFLVVTGFYAANNHFEWLPTMFSRLALFGKRFSAPCLLGNALGDWLVYAAMLFWWSVFFHQSLKTVYQPEKRSTAFVKTVGAYTAMMLGVLASVLAFRQLVFVSGVEVDFGNVVGINAYSLAALGSIILLMAAIFLFSHKLMTIVRNLDLSRQHRMMAQAISLGIFLVATLLLPAGKDIAWWYVAGFALLFTVLFDYFIHWETAGFGWVVLWLLLFSIFSAFLLNRFNQQQEHRRLEKYAVALAENRDTLFAEKMLREIVANVAVDPQLPYLLKPWPFKPSAAVLRQYFNSQLFKTNYLFDYFRLEVYAFDRERQAFLLEQTNGWQEVMAEHWDACTALGNTPAIRFGTDKTGVFQYVLRFDVNRMQDPTQPATVIFVLHQTFPQAGPAYTQHYTQSPFKGLDFLPRYDFSVVRDGKLAAEQGQNSLAAGNLPVEQGTCRVVRTENPPREDAVARSNDGQTVAVVGRASAPWYRQIYLFAILFTLASIVLFALALLNPLLGILPSYFGLVLTTKGSLSRRIHYWNITLIVLAFIAIGVMTFSHFNTTARQSNRAGFDYRTEAVLTNLRTQFGDEKPGTDSLRTLLPDILRPLSSSLGMDVNFYSPDGDLLYANRQDLRELGLIPAKLAVPTMDLLRTTAKASVEASDLLAGKPIGNKYMPVRNAGNQLLGYLNMPFHENAKQIGPEVSDFMGMLASLYVFLLLIAGTATLVLARSITKPVQLISDKIKELRFEDKNLPLDYQGDRSDELGELIGEYNRMVDKLEASKIQLIRLEREGAWREMARQIAHDIKNPLTTMKLSMQQLERVSNDPMQAAAYLKKAITRLIEQIDSLAQIASEFSMFANLEIRQRQDMVLNDVVESVHDLFSEQKEVELVLNLPKERFHVSGDKSHLIRVFNNLVINAIQAIPQDRKGKIQVMMYRQGDDAIVQIRDNGGGIPPEIQVRVFEPNFTTKSSGSGLGLAICRRIIEALDGNIRFETRQAEGTDFFVSLPITSVE